MMKGGGLRCLLRMRELKLRRRNRVAGYDAKR
jgi:hypothetical protein